MDCNDFLHGYSEYDDSLLGAEERRLFDQHLTSCASCARYDRVLRKGRMLARQLPKPVPGEDFVPRLQDRLERLRAERERRLAPPVLGGAAAGLAAVTVVLTALWTVSALDPGGEPESLAADPGVTGPAATAAGWTPVWPGVELQPRPGWAAGRVDHQVVGPYSPLVTGPPAYRAAGAVQASFMTTPTLRRLE
jgi:anti-sigma factor RsiW